ncbi:MAG: hypothetical protein AB2L22_07980 [Syntrophales bacterium]
MARVACAPEYRGVKNVAILDGGHSQRVRENRVISRESEEPAPKMYSRQIDRRAFARREVTVDDLDIATAFS